MVYLTELAQLSPLISPGSSQVFLRTVTQSETGNVSGASKWLNSSSFIHLGKWINI